MLPQLPDCMQRTLGEQRHVRVLPDETLFHDLRRLILSLQVPGCITRMQVWIDEMAAFVKALDPNHLVTVGAEGFWGPVRVHTHTLYTKSY